MKQLTFDFGDENKYNINDFIISPENIEAFYYINQDEENGTNTNNLIFLSGERKSGKTFLANIWKIKNNAKFIIYNNLFELSFDDFVIKTNQIIEHFDYYIIDNFEKTFDEQKLLFLINSIIQHNSKLLIVSNFIFSKIKFNIKDLKSRINAGVFLRIKRFSKEIKPMLILKIFSTKYIKISGQVLRFLVQKLPNDYEGIFNSINDIIKKSAGKKISLNVVREILG